MLPLLLALALAFVPLAAASSLPKPSIAASEAAEHPPIRISGDADLLLPDAVARNGVTGGSGTREDPYVISGWTIRYGRMETGVVISGVRVHLVLRDLLIQPIETPAYGRVGGTSFAIADSLNIRIENVTIVDDWAGATLRTSNVEVVRSTFVNSTLLIEGSHARLDETRHLGSSAVVGCTACRVVLQDTLHEAWDLYGPGPPENPRQLMPVALVVSSEMGDVRVVLEGSSVGGFLGGAVHQSGGTLQIRDSVVRSWQLAAVEVRDGALAATGSALLDAKEGASGFVVIGGRADLEDVEVSGPAAVGIDLRDSIARVERATLTGQETSLRAWLEGVEPRGVQVVVRNSSFLQSGHAAVDVRPETARIDARFNHWGSNRGPLLGESEDGRGGILGNAEYEPFLIRTDGQTASGRGAPISWWLPVGALAIAASVLLRTETSRRMRRR